MRLTVERQFMKLIGETVRTFDESGTLLCRADQKAFKLKEQIYFFHDEDKQQPYFSVMARNIIDIAPTYDIFNAEGVKVCSLKRKGLSSTFVRDHWLILNESEVQIGEIIEDSNMLGVLRRYIDFVALFVPQEFELRIENQIVGNMQQNKNPFTVKLHCDFSDDITSTIGTLLPLAIPSVLALIEARQN